MIFPFNKSQAGFSNKMTSWTNTKKSLEDMGPVVPDPRKNTGIPKALMVAKLGSDAALQQALMDGDVFVIKDAGRDFYAWRSIEVERSSGVRHETSLNSKETAIDETQQMQMGAFFDNFNPQLGQPK